MKYNHLFISMTNIQEHHHCSRNWPVKMSSSWTGSCLWSHLISLYERHRRPGWWGEWSTISSPWNRKPAPLIQGQGVPLHFIVSLLVGGLGRVGICLRSLFYYHSGPCDNSKARRGFCYYLFIYLFILAHLWNSSISAFVLPEELNRASLRESHGYHTSSVSLWQGSASL
jgi:hypothetical protein